MEKEVNDMLKFSVIVPCYNAEGPIRTCLNSILAKRMKTLKLSSSMMVQPTIAKLFWTNTKKKIHEFTHITLKTQV